MVSGLFGVYLNIICFNRCLAACIRHKALTCDMNYFIRITGLITFAVLLVFALLFFKERTITFDMSSQEIFLLITHKFVLNLRVGAAIPQTIPLILQWLNCPLSSMLMVYSASYVVFYFLFFLVIAFVFRQGTVALVFLLSMLLVVNDTFYWIQSELPQGLAWLMLYYAYIEKRGPGDITRRPWLHFLLIMFIQSFHPLIFFHIFYVLIFSVYKHYKLDLGFYKWPVAIAVTDFGLRIWVSRFDQYESAKLDLTGVIKAHADSIAGFVSNGKLMLIAHVPYLTVVILVTILVLWYARKRRTLGPILALLFGAGILLLYFIAKQLSGLLPSVAKELHFAKSDYLIYWLIFLFTIFVLGLRRRFWELSMLVLFTMGYLMLICVAGSSADKFYLENMMLPLGIFVLLPFVHILADGYFKFPRQAQITVLAIVSIRLAFIFNTHTPYTSRLFWYGQRFAEMDRAHTQRLMLTEKSVPMDTLVMSWASGYESLILSSLDGPEHSKSIVIDKDLAGYQPYLNSDSLTLAKWGVWSPKDLPGNYFLMRPGRY